MVVVDADSAPVEKFLLVVLAVNPLAWTGKIADGAGLDKVTV
tara:strand:+ start:240 stop:365 length:126 start_codon:yes stop_codon:yes gene_type:complete